MVKREAPTVVIGLDGAHFELLDPWLDNGLLPNIQTAIDNGVSGDLISVLPPVTSPNWKCYSTGKNPGKIGIFWWENIDVDRKEIYYPDSRKKAHKQYWEHIADAADVGVVGVPLTYPPRSFDGLLVAGAPDGENSGYTHPPELERELRDRFDYRVTKQNRLDTNRDKAVQEILDLIKLRFEVGSYLLDEKNLEFLQITTFYINSLHHFLWDDEATRTAWQIVDEYVGEYIDSGCNVMLMSDHGSTEIDWEFHINAWLQQQGYLSTNLTVPELLHRFGLHTGRLIDIATKLGIQQTAKGLTPEFVLNYLPNEDKEIGRERKASHIDWDSSTAIASGQGPIYLNLSRENEEYENVRNQIISQLSSILDPDGNRIASAIHRGEEIYHGQFASEAPDIVVEQSEGIHISGRIGRGEVFTSPASGQWKAENKRPGLFVACGPDLAKERTVELSIMDLAPTFLHLFNRSVPKSMDGRVQKKILAETSVAASRDVQYESREVDNEKHIENIRSIARSSDL